MARVLIVDHLKSTVMTSEIFKDKISGCSVDIVKSGIDCVEYLKENRPDMIVADFDLPIRMASCYQKQSGRFTTVRS